MAVEPPSLWGTVAAERLRLNPFRVLGLGVDASAAQVRRAADKAAAAGRLGSVPAPGGPFPLPAGPDPAAVREAAHQLRDPAARLLAETFWFHPDPGPEPARWSLDDGQDLDDLCRAWDGLWEDDDEKRGVAALHNLAVVELVRALDAEAARGPVRGESAGPGAATGAASPQDWTDTLDAWVSLLDEDESVADLRRRAVALELASTASEPAERLRTMLARAVLDPLVQSACRDLDRGGVPHQDLIERLVEADLPGDAGTHAVHRIVQHTDERIRSVADPGWQRVRKDETAALEVAHELIETLGGPLALLRTARAAGVDQGLAQRAADDVATTLAACATRIATLHPERRTEAVRIARRGADLAIGADAIGQTAWALTSLLPPGDSRSAPTGREPEETGPGRCTECARPLPAPQGAMTIPMWRPTEPGSQVVERQDFHVPWCRRCALRGLVHLPLAGIRVIGALAWIPLLVIWGFRQETGWLEWAAAAVAARSFSIWWINRRRQRVFRQLRTQPAMRAALDQGWRGSPGFEFDA